MVFIWYVSGDAQFANVYDSYTFNEQGVVNIVFQLGKQTWLYKSHSESPELLSISLWLGRG